MKKTFLLTLAVGTLLIQTPATNASPASRSQHQAQISRMCQDQQVRLMLLHELTNTPERKQEVAKVLTDKGYFVRYPNAKATGAAEGQTVNRATNNL